MAHCRKCDRQLTSLALSFALASAGKSMPAKMAMMAMTTSSSMRVKAERDEAREHGKT